MATNNNGEHSVDLEGFEQSHHGSSVDHPHRSPPSFEPESEIEGSSVHNDSSINIDAPEKEIILFALRLAVLEKSASGLGTLAFVWATVVLLGGFAIFLSRRDFWFVTIILVVEGARIYSRSGELKWQHHSTWSIATARSSFRNAFQSSSNFVTHAVKACCRPRSTIETSNRMRSTHQPQTPSQSSETPRAWKSFNVPGVSFAGRVFLLNHIGRVLVWLQVGLALGSMSLSLHQLIRQEFGGPDDVPGNRDTALNLFYSLALADDLLFLLEKLYWTWKISFYKLLEEVSRKCGFETSKLGGIDLVNRFLYDVYSVCISDSLFNGLKMDLVSFAGDLLVSNSPDEQLMGAQILYQFAAKKEFASVTLRKVGTSGKIIEKLVEMLSWKNTTEAEIRGLAAEIVSMVSQKSKFSLRVAAVPGSMEAIASLLQTGSRSTSHDELMYEFSAFNLHGLLILENLASERDNCQMISKSSGLLSKIVEFTRTNPNLLQNEHAAYSQVKLVQRALQVVKLLVTTKGDTGNMVRKKIAENVFTISNIREILKYGETHVILQKLSIDILTSLAMDEEGTERIASTGGVIKLLVAIFFKLEVSECLVCGDAGEALAMLTLKSEKSCNLILRENDILERLIVALEEPPLRLQVSRILRNICAYVAPESSSRLYMVTKALPIVLEETINASEKQLEVSIGLLIEASKFMEVTKFNEELDKAGTTPVEFVDRLMSILKDYKYPDIKVPRVRRFVVELVKWLMRCSSSYLELFKRSEMKMLLESVAETTSEVENFHVFSGSVGLFQHSSTVVTLVDEALQLLHQGSSENP